MHLSRFCSFSLAITFFGTGHGSLRKIQSIKSYHSIITKLVDNNGRVFFLKEAKYCRDIDLLQPVLEALGTAVAQSIQIPVGSTRLIKARESNTSKYCTYKPALLQSRVPGNVLSELPQFSHINICQRFDNRPQNLAGFSYATIKSMAFDPQLAKIVALDLFIGNRDRANHNLSYDQKTNTFYALDFDASFITNLCKWAVIQLKNLALKKTHFNLRELKALSVCKETLAQLIKINPPHVLAERFTALLQKSGLYTSSHTKKLIEHRTNKHNYFIEKSSKYAQMLIAAIESILKSHRA